MADAGSRSRAPSVISSHSRSAGNPVSARTDDHQLAEAGLGQLLRRDVDRHRRDPGGGARRRPCRRPRRALPAGLAEHPGTEFDHQPALLGQVDELRRREEAPHRVPPAHERLGADDLQSAAGRLAAGSGGRAGPPGWPGATRWTSAGSCRRRRRRRSAYTTYRPGPSLLGLVHGDVGAAQQHGRAASTPRWTGPRRCSGSRTARSRPRPPGVAIAPRSRATISTASSSPATSQSTVNSSPPNRARKSPVPQGAAPAAGPPAGAGGPRHRARCRR